MCRIGVKGWLFVAVVGLGRGFDLAHAERNGAESVSPTALSL